VARKENNTSQQTGQKVMNEKKVYFQSYTASKVTNRGSKICVNPFSAKLLPAFKKERKLQYSSGGKDFCTFFRAQNTSEILNY